MKMQCVNNKVEKGWFNKTKHKVNGLTKGKIYNVLLYSNSYGFQFINTTPRFLVYNDNNEWQEYNPNRFKPMG